MQKQLLWVVLSIVLALLIPGASSGREWLSTLQPVSSFGDAPEPTVDRRGRRRSRYGDDIKDHLERLPTLRQRRFMKFHICAL